MQIDASDFDGACDEWAAQVIAKRPQATRRAAEYIKGLSQAKTPVETGNLRAEHDVRAQGDGGAEVYVPGPYARYQHYGLDFHHEEGQALYLEQAMVEGAPEAIRIMGEALA